jgi:hypothetical protein
MGLTIESRTYFKHTASLPLAKVVSRTNKRSCYVGKQQQQEDSATSSAASESSDSACGHLPAVSNAVYRKRLLKHARQLDARQDFKRMSSWEEEEDKVDTEDTDDEDDHFGNYIDKPCRLQVDVIARITGVDLHGDGTIRPSTVVRMYDQVRSAIRNAVLYRINAMQLFQDAEHDVDKVPDSWKQRKHWGILRSYNEFTGAPLSETVDLVDVMALSMYPQPPKIDADTDVDCWLEEVENLDCNNSFNRLLAFLKQTVQCGHAIFRSC